MRQEINSIISDGIDIVDCINYESLNRFTSRQSLAQISQIPWERIQELHILGSDSIEINRKEIDFGCYLDDSKSWVLVIGATKNQIENIIYRCGRSLKSLDMRFLPIGKPDFHFLSNLEFLRLSSIDGFQELEGLNELYKLCELEISFSALGSRLDVSALSGLKKIDLTGNPALTHVDGLSQLINLEELDLSGTAVGPELDLSALHKLKRIQVVDARNLERIFGLGQNPDLEHLDLACSSVRRIPDDVRELKKLIHLDLSNLKLDELPDWLPDLGLDFTSYDDGINIRRTAVAGKEMSLFDQQQITEENFSNYQQQVKRWFEDQRNNTPRPLNELRVIFLGDGEVGKSYTISRLMNDGGFPEGLQDTTSYGIEISDKELQIGDRKVMVHFWDFGGQIFLHSLHRMFMTPNALYVVMLNARNETQNERAQYWLNSISSFAADAPVLVVLNKIDQNPNASINERALRIQHPNLKRIVRMSAREDSMECFQQGFVAILAEQIEAYIDEKRDIWPVTWLKLKDILQKESNNYISKNQYNQLLATVAIEQKDGNSILQKLKDLGICSHHDINDSEDIIVLYPDWFINALYAILSCGSRYARNGIITHEHIATLLNSPTEYSDINQQLMSNVCYTSAEINFILGMMRKYHISYEFSDGLEFMPSLCQKNLPSIVKQYAARSDFKEFRLEYEYLPIDALHHLMISSKDDLDIDNVWLTGARFVHNVSGQGAVVIMEGNRLQILLDIGDSQLNCDRYLNQILLAMENINDKLGLKVVNRWISYVHDEMREMFDYDMLTATLDAGIPSVYSTSRRQLVNINEIITLTDQRSEQNQKTLIADMLNILSQMRINQLFWNQSEDARNSYLRDSLRSMGYYVSDQTLQGISVSKKLSGELDLDIRRYASTPWTMCEALQISTGSKGIWNEHLDKLLDNYNPHGLPFMILLTYVDCNLEKYNSIWMNYRDHIHKHCPALFDMVPNSFESVYVERLKENRWINAVKCQYKLGDYSPTVYHLFVQMGR